MQDASPLHEPSAGSGWGELADLKTHLIGIIMAYRQTSRSDDQLQTLDRELEGVRDNVRRWIETERWAMLPPGDGALHKLSESLNRGMLRHAEVQEQNLEAVRQVGADLLAAVTDARTAAEQAEGGFVEATALLTTVRELERLGADLHRALSARALAVSPAMNPAMNPADRMGELITEVRSAVLPLTRSVDVLHQLADQVHVLGNRATLIALHSVLATRPGEGQTEPVTPDEMKSLARDAREATDRVQALARELGAQLRASNDRIAALAVLQERARAEAEPAPEPALSPDVLRAIDRVREMIQDAARKSERLSAAGERSSRAADRLVRRLEEEIRDLEGLEVRLAPPVERISAMRVPTPEHSFGLIEMSRAETSETRDRREELP
jgi:hypothetical protein